MDIRSNTVSRFRRQRGDSKPGLIGSAMQNPIAFCIGLGLIILGFAAGTALCEALDGGALAADFFSSLDKANDIAVWAGLLRSTLFNISLAATVLLMRVSMAIAPLSCIALVIKGLALGFAFLAAGAADGGLFMSVFAVLLPSLPTLTALSLLFSGARDASGAKILANDRLLRDMALFLLGVLAEGLLSQAIALFIDAAA